MKADRITVSRSKRGTTIKATGASAQVLFDAMAGGAKAPVVLAEATQVIHFEDHGQDLLRLYVDASGTVVDSQPYHADIYRGAKLIGAAEVGEQVAFQRAGQKPQAIVYPVARVVLVGEATESP